MCVCACACVCRCLQKSEEAARAHEAAVTGSRKSLDVDAGHPTSVLWRAVVVLNFWAIYFPFPLIFFVQYILVMFYPPPPSHQSFPTFFPANLWSFRNKIKQKSTKMKIKASKQKPSIQKVTKQKRVHTFFFKKKEDSALYCSPSPRYEPCPLPPSVLDTASNTLLEKTDFSLCWQVSGAESFFVWVGFHVHFSTEC